MRIDCHVHGDPQSTKGDPEAYVESCRRRGIDAVVLIEPLQTCLDAVKKFGDFVVPVAIIDTEKATPKDVESIIDAGCKGIKFIGPAHPYGEACYWPLYEKIQELGAVAVFHTGYLGSEKPENRPVWMEHMRAAQIDVVARRFTDLKILMSHFSNPWWEEAWKVSWSRKNVYADLSGGTAIYRSMCMWAETFAPDGVRVHAGAAGVETVAALPEADIVLCHRSNDYHPDHRAVGVLVQDAAYVVTVPNAAPLTPRSIFFPT